MRNRQITKEINESPMFEQRIIPVTLESGLAEIIFENRDWICNGSTFSWEYYLSADKMKVIINRW